MKSTKNNLHRKLKASDRRRRRRQSSAVAVAVSDELKSPDVMGLIAAAIVQRAETDRDLVDRAVIAALRGCLHGNQPEGTQSQPLCDQFNAIAKREDVSTRAFHVAIKQLLQHALEHRDKNQGNDSTAFLDYLAVLCN